MFTCRGQKMASLMQSSEGRPIQIGAWLRQLRVGRKLIVRKVAAAVGMDMAHLSKVELGDRLPTQEQAASLARFYDIPPYEMEAARMAGKFLRDLRDHPAAPRALEIVQESAAAFGVGKSVNTRRNIKRKSNPKRVEA